MNKLFVIAALSASLAGCVVFGPWRGYDHRWDDRRREQRDQRHDHYSDNRNGDFYISMGNKLL